MTTKKPFFAGGVEDCVGYVGNACLDERHDCGRG